MERGCSANSGGWRFRVSTLLVLCGVMLLPGCGGGGPARPKPVPVKGTVTFRGKPLANARVMFWGEKAPMPAVGDTNDAGEFELSMYGKGDGALAGANKVTVVSLSSSQDAGGGVMPDATKLATKGETVPLDAKIANESKAGVVLPKMYGDSSNTTLTWTVKPEGETDVKLELK